MPRRQCQWGYSVFYCWVAYTITSVSSLMRTCSLRPPRWYQWYGLSKSSFCKDCILGLPSTTEPPNSMSMCAWPNKRARQLLSYSLNIFVLTAEYTPACSMLKWERMWCIFFVCFIVFIWLHLPKQTWNLKMDPWKRRFLLETIISRFHVEFRGVYYFQLFPHVFGWFFPCKLQFCSSFES